MLLFGSRKDLENHLKGAVSLDNGDVRLENEDKFRDKVLDDLAANAALNESREIRGLSRHIIKSAALDLGAISASIEDLYEARGKGKMHGFTVPAINVRGMPYPFSRTIFRAAQKINCGAFIFELAKSEMGYTHQRPHEFAMVILAAAIKEKFRGPVFIQGDHYQINAKNFSADREKETQGLKQLIKEAINAGYYNIDIDTSTLVTLDKPTVKEQQRANFEMGVEFTSHIRDLEPEGVVISVGGEIGEVGKENSNEEELRAYMDNFLECLGKKNKNHKGISKISIQTGTSHGGVPLPDGSVADVKLDFDTLEKLSRISRERYGLAGAVQHGASTLPAELFHKFPELETAEIHLATDFQNMIYESKNFPKDLKQEIYTHLRAECANEKKAGETDEQFIYKTRKKGFGGKFKPRFWQLPETVQTAIARELEGKLDFLFDQLKVRDTNKYVQQTVRPVKIRPVLKDEIEYA
ncbi:MAG: class II fructose-bisphosphate aldolase [Nitrospinae bacterium]|nr:class II fructose-bisphosphate aldolase [Nitrospinota bacterium]